MAQSTPAKRSRRTGHNWKKTRAYSAVIDPKTGKPMSRFKRRKHERTPAGRAQLANMRRAQRNAEEAAAVAADAKRRLKDAAEGR